jgi:hypothetical protein
MAHCSPLHLLFVTAPTTKRPALSAATNIDERENGAQGRDRTTDTVIFSHVLYQLSYLGAETPPNGGACDGGAL